MGTGDPGHHNRFGNSDVVVCRGLVEDQDFLTNSDLSFIAPMPSMMNP